ELDNRRQSYAFFAKHFDMPAVEREICVDGEVKSLDDLRVGLPENNLTISSLARKLASAIQRRPIPSARSAGAGWARASRARLKNVVRYAPVTVKHAWPVFSNSSNGLETLGYRLEFSNDLSAT